MRTTIKIMDLYCLPSIRSGLSVAIMEVMAAGVICVASSIKGNVDLMSDKRSMYDNETNVKQTILRAEGGWSCKIYQHRRNRFNKCLKANEDNIEI